MLIRHQTVIAASCLKTNWRFASFVPLRASYQKLSLKRTTAGRRRILSTASLTLFEVLLTMIVLPAGQVLHQSSAGIFSSDSVSWHGCVCVACFVVRVCWFTISPSPLFLDMMGTEIWRKSDFKKARKKNRFPSKTFCRNSPCGNVKANVFRKLLKFVESPEILAWSPELRLLSTKHVIFLSHFFLCLNSGKPRCPAYLTVVTDIYIRTRAHNECAGEREGVYVHP